MNSLELRIPPVALSLLFALAMAAVAYLVPAQVNIPAKTGIALSVALAGGFVALAGVIAFRQHKTTANPLKPEQSSSLVATGIYRFSRNPMYLGFLLVLAGWSVYLANWATVLLLPLFMVYMNKFQIQPEERALAERFGAHFQAYCNTVRRWL